MNNSLYNLFSILFFLCLGNLNLNAQLPAIEAPNIITPTYRVYISTAGSDANDGSSTNPVATFSRALDLIPFHESSHVYAEIVFKEGTYYPSSALVQTVAQFEQSGFTKNVSVVGEGEVNIYGDNMPAGSTILSLRGSHVRVENINLYNAKNSAIYWWNHIGSTDRRMSDILIKDVFVDSTRSHGVIVRFVDKIVCDNVIVTRGQYENTGVGGYCAWGSALRIEFGNQILIKNCQTYYNRGEGINVACSKNAVVENCVSYDNFAPNFYLIRASEITFRNNLSYNFDSTYWRTCVPGSGAPIGEITPTAGLSIANEVAYDDLPTGFICTPSRNISGAYTIKMADSIFIYNNVFIMAPFYLIDESFGDVFCLNVHSNNFSNIYIENNTFIGDIAPSHPFQNRDASLSFVFNPSFFQGCLGGAGTAAYRCENIVFKNNIVSLSETSSLGVTGIDPVSVLYGGRPCNGGALGSKFTVSNNLWHHELPAIIDHYLPGSSTTVPNFFYNTATDVIDEEMLTHCDPNNLEQLIPNAEANENKFYHTSVVSPYVSHDYLGRPRSSSGSNVGAFELNTISSNDNDIKSIQLSIYPNPVNDKLYIVKSEKLLDLQALRVVDITGRIQSINYYESKGQFIVDVSSLNSGIYFVLLTGTNGDFVCKFIKQ